jgi:hypothetical protein
MTPGFEPAELAGDEQLAKLRATIVMAPTVNATFQRRERKKGFDCTLEDSTETD